MRVPIQYALCYPDRPPVAWKRLSLLDVASLTFEPPDFERFPCLALAYRAGREGGTAPAALNAANEVAVEAFLMERIGFGDIARCVESVLEAHTVTDAGDLESILEADAWARHEASEWIRRRGRRSSGAEFSQKGRCLLTFLQMVDTSWLSGALLTAVSFIVIFGTIVLFHELGHFAAAKAFGVKVFEFSVGIGPPLATLRRRETQYSIRMLP